MGINHSNSMFIFNQNLYYHWQLFVLECRILNHIQLIFSSMPKESVIWVDADACPKVVKEIIYRAADRVQIKVILVANQCLVLPTKSKFISSVQVPKGLDVADNYIVENLKKDDLVITADIPLAYEVVNSHAFALNPRGEFYTKANIGARLSMRNLMNDLRNSGQISGGPGTLTKRERMDFANSLDTFLQKAK